MQFLGRLLTLLSVLCFSCAAFGQATGLITGTVHDTTGAVIQGAEIAVTDLAKGTQLTTVTNAEGNYLVAGLGSGAYDITVIAPGFKKFQARGVRLEVAEKARVDVTLQVGAVTSEVTVEGPQVAQVETQSSDLAGVVGGKEITQLQLNGRNFVQLATLVPGINNQSGQDEGTVGINGNIAFSINGGRTEYNKWEIDGGDKMDNGSNVTLNVYPSIDAISEFRVLTSNYGAQYGRNGSGTIQVETKSGSNAFHGNVYEFVRNDAFNARNYFEETVPSYKKNDFGYTLGGPVYIPGVYNKNKDKTFFFWSQEWRRDRVPSQVFNTPVPSLAQRAGNFSELCPSSNTPFSRDQFPDCPGVANPDGSLSPYMTGGILNQVPVDAAGSALLPLIPAPTTLDNYFTGSVTLPTNWRQELIRVDHNFSPRMRAMFRYIHDSWDTVTESPIWTGSNFPTVQTNFKGPGVGLVARLTAEPTSTLINEFTFSYTTNHIFFGSTGTPNANAWRRPANLPMGYLFNNGFGGKLPAITLSGGEVYGGGFAQEPDGEWPEGLYNSNPTYTFRDNVSKMLGRHNLQFGAYFVAAQKNELSSALINGSLEFDNTSPVSTGNAFADLLMGQVYSYSQGSNQLKYYYRYKIFEPYIQDDWRITDRLTLNLGLRLSLFGLYREKYNNGYNWSLAAYNPANAPQLDVDGSVTGFAGALIPGTGDPFNGLVRCGVNGVPDGCMQGRLFNPAPRIGFAWDPFGKGKTAIRGGYGLFWEHTNGNEGNVEGMMCCGQSSPLVRTAVQYNISGYGNLGGGGTVEFPMSFMSVPNKVVWPYVQQWHLDVQHEVLKSTIATVSYVGSKGTHLNRQLDLNQLPPLAASLNPYLPGQAISDADCNSLQNIGFPNVSGVVNGNLITGPAAVGLQTACGNDATPYRPFRGINTITLLDNNSSSIYHALQTSLRRNVGGLQLSLAYTYSHSIDDASDRWDYGLFNVYNPGASRASSNFDMRHMLNIGYVYDLPFFRTPGLTHTFLGGWQVSGITTFQTGTPYSVVNSGAFSDNAGVANGIGTGSYPDLIGDPNANVPRGLAGNPHAFTAPRGLTYGTAPRNLMTNPHRTNFDMALFKRFAINERSGLEFRAEAFNVFNHTQWAPISGEGGSAPSAAGAASWTNGYGASDFLNILAAHNPRILQLGLKFFF